MSFDEDPRENDCPDCNEYEKERMKQSGKIKQLERVILSQAECLDNASKELNELLDICYLRKHLYWYENADAAYKQARQCLKEHANQESQFR